ncbi:MMPL family transporter [Marinilabiliaceae bacterium ANBcel2]|nr:MMPL family transporter [Marinilabiliaceae bacterium ANBcel2]
MNILISKHRALFIIVILLLTILSISQLPKLKINPGFDDYIPDEVGNRAYMEKLDTIFGGNERLMLILTADDIINKKSFERLEKITSQLEALEGVEGCASLLDVVEIKNEGGVTLFEQVFSDITDDTTKIEEVKERLLNNNTASRFISDDFSSTAIILTKSNDIEDDTIVNSINEVVKTYSGFEEVYLGGQAYLRSSIKSYIGNDLFILLPASLILMVVMLYLSFREWRGVLLPFSVVVLSVIFSFGVMSVLGWEISLVSILLPVMLIAIANDYGIHLINLYQEKFYSGKHNNLKSVSIEIYYALRKPILITALTTIGGMMGLLAHKMKPAAQLGVLASVGIAIAFLISIFLIPVLLSLYPAKEKLKLKRGKQRVIVFRFFKIFSRWIALYPKRIIIWFGVVTLLSTVGISFLKVDTNIEGYFAGNSDISKGVELVNKKFGGSQYVSVLFKGDVLTPAFLNRVTKYVDEIEEIPQIGHILSPDLFFRELSKGFYSQDEKGYNSLPSTEKEARQYIELASFFGFEEEVSGLIDFNREYSRILVSMTDGSNNTGKIVLDALNDIIKDDSMVVAVAGPGLSKIQMADMVIRGQIASLILALLIIFILLSFIFKSLAAGVKGSLPMLLSVMFLFGTMGFLGIALDLVTALLSSIMIGVGIDYTIHFLWRYKIEYSLSKDNDTAIYKTLSTAGRGILFNAMSVIIGFSVLVFSSFAPLRFFGILIVISIFACLISAFLLIPAIVTVTKPRFLRSNGE